MNRLLLTPEVYRVAEIPETWAVEAIDVGRDGDIYTAVFQGPNAERLAREYAA